MSALEVLPKNGNVAEWSDQERALVEAAGLVSRGQLAPRPTVEAFLQHCRRTGLDPIARQIYAIERGGKWGIQISIDGARLVAERSKEYMGQTSAQWTADGVTWVDVWLSKEPPAAARVGVYRKGWPEPLTVTSTWDQYAQPNSPMWKKMPALMLSKTAEMLALRKAFPQDLSGLYSAEEMDQAAPAPVERPTPVQEPVAASRDWFADGEAVATVEGLRDLYREAAAVGALNVTRDGVPLAAFLTARADELNNPAPVEDVVDAEVVEDDAAEPVTEWPVTQIPGADEAQPVDESEKPF